MLMEQYAHRLRSRPNPAEVRSWERSLYQLSGDLIEAGLDGVEALVEYQLPLTSKRADVVLAGVHPRTGRPSYVVIELKQWTAAELVDGTTDVVRFDQYSGERLHPIEQVRRYGVHLTDFLSELADEPDALAGAAYLHNATDHAVRDLFALEIDDRTRLFTGQRRASFLSWLRTRL